MNSDRHTFEILNRRLGGNAEQDSLKLDLMDVDVAGPDMLFTSFEAALASLQALEQKLLEKMRGH